MEKKIEVLMYDPVKDGDAINWVAVHPLTWDRLVRAYGINQAEVDLVGFNTDSAMLAEREK